LEGFAVASLDLDFVVETEIEADVEILVVLAPAHSEDRFSHCVTDDIEVALFDIDWDAVLTDY